MTDRCVDAHPQILRSVRVDDRKKLADLRPVIGRRVERALALCGVTKQEAAFAMGYTDAGTVSRWCSGTERPHLDKLEAAIAGFEAAWVRAIAEGHPRMEAVTQIVMRP